MIPIEESFLIVIKKKFGVTPNCHSSPIILTSGSSHTPNLV